MVRVPAWEGDYAGRLKARLQARGYASASEFAAAFPRTSLVALAATLGTNDVAAVQLERLLYEEAIERGTVERFARDLLVREIHDNLPEGWRRDWGPDIPGDTTTARWRRSTAATGWATAVGSRPEYDAAADRVMFALRDKAPFPDGWLPADADDPLLVAFFREHWRP